MASKQRGKGSPSLITAVLENGDVALYWDTQPTPGAAAGSGGSVRLDHTELDHTALEIYTNQDAQVVDRPLVRFFADHAAFDEAVLELRNDGTGPALRVIGGFEMDVIQGDDLTLAGNITAADGDIPLFNVNSDFLAGLDVTGGTLDVSVDANFSAGIDITAGGLVVSAGNTQVQDLEIDGALNHDGTTVGLYGVGPVTRQTVSGSASGGFDLAGFNALQAVVSDLAAKLDNTGIIEDTTT